MCYRGHIAVVTLIDPETLEKSEITGKVTVHSEESNGVFIKLPKPGQLSDSLEPVAAPDVATLPEIVRIVCESYGAKPSDILSDSQKRQAASIRHSCMYVARWVTPLSLSEIGDYFNRDHSSVHRALELVNKKISENLDYLHRLNGFIDILGGGRG